MPAVINLDFADVNNTLKDSGIALIGFGMGQGENRSEDAAMTALNCPLIEQSVQGARKAICHVTCGPQVSLYECQETVNRIIEASGGQLDLKFGISINDQLSDQIMLSIIASSFTNDVTFGISKSQPSNIQQNSQFSLFDNDSFAKNPQTKGAEGQEVSNESVETPKQDNYLDGDSIIPDFLEGKF